MLSYKEKRYTRFLSETFYCITHAQSLSANQISTANSFAAYAVRLIFMIGRISSSALVSVSGMQARKAQLHMRSVNRFLFGIATVFLNKFILVAFFGLSIDIPKTPESPNIIETV